MGDNPSKQSVLSKWFEGEHVLIHLDARRTGVDVPEHLRGNHSLTLKLSGFFRGPTDWNNDSVIAILLFNGDYHRCVVPWNAIWGMTSSGNEQRIWLEDLPIEIVRDLTLTKLRDIGSRLIGIKREKESGEEPHGESSDRPSPYTQEGRKRKPTLRRVK